MLCFGAILIYMYILYLISARKTERSSGNIGCFGETDQDSKCYTYHNDLEMKWYILVGSSSASTIHALLIYAVQLLTSSILVDSYTVVCWMSPFVI